jgi:HD-GYP domain-containing protein (c-di-GMP phosphodiesterase class II)
MGGDEFCVLAWCTDEDGQAIARRAAGALHEVGEAFSVGCSVGTAMVPTEASSVEAALRLADTRMYEVKVGRMSADRQSTDVLLTALGEHNPQLYAHSNTVTALARRTALAFDLPEHELRRIELAAELHDIGKVAIPGSILEKRGPLDPEEWSFIRRHTEIGERIVLAAPALAPTAPLIRSSHERYDGAGYPDGLASDDIPLGARIIAVCDAFDAMTTSRAYCDAFGVDEALSELRRCAGSQFDPEVVTRFCASIGASEPGTPAFAETGSRSV